MKLDLTKIRLNNLKGLYDRVLNSEESLNKFKEIDEVSVDFSHSKKILFFQIYLKDDFEKYSEFVKTIKELLEMTNFYKNFGKDKIEIPVVFFDVNNKIIKKIFL